MSGYYGSSANSICVADLEKIQLDHDLVKLDLNKRVRELEEKVKKLEEMQKDMITMPNIIWGKYHKTPYKCPVCDGKGEFKLSSMEEISANNGQIFIDCKPCKAEGIVWG